MHGSKQDNASRAAALPRNIAERASPPAQPPIAALCVPRRVRMCEFAALVRVQTGAACDGPLALQWPAPPWPAPDPETRSSSSQAAAQSVGSTVACSHCRTRAAQPGPDWTGLDRTGPAGSRRD
jgi:hypothetical protein